MDLLKNVLSQQWVFLVIPWKFVWMNNQERKVRPKIPNVNSYEPSFYPHSNEINKCSGTCNNINHPCAKLFVHDAVKNISKYLN